jgi:hypothetical protein
VHPEPLADTADRLDSWKSIAEYLDRDVATVRRWEKSAGLPVRRVAGSRGHSVFAYRSEIDGWLKGTKAEPQSIDSSTPSSQGTPAARPIWRWSVVTTAGVLILLSVAWRVRSSRAADPPAAIVEKAGTVVATGRNGTELWQYSFPKGEVNVLLADRQGTRGWIFGGRDPGVLIAVAQRTRSTPERGQAGQLLWLSLAGSLKRTFGFTDEVAFGNKTYREPWLMTDVAAEESSGSRRLAVSAHHFHWWPSLVTVLDSSWTRRGTFVNAGWVDRLEWLSPDRLLVSGFNNARDGGMVALLDPQTLDGRSPASDDPTFTCTSCGSGAPLRYVVLPRSEVNRASASPFNRAVLELLPDRIIVRTIEMPATGSSAIDAIYEFTRTLDLISAAYSDRYWEVHQALHAQGKIDHPRERCPGRNGPMAIELWDPATGWTTKPTRL